MVRSLDEFRITHFGNAKSGLSALSLMLNAPSYDMEGRSGCAMRKQKLFRASASGEERRLQFWSPLSQNQNVASRRWSVIAAGIHTAR